MAILAVYVSYVYAFPTPTARLPILLYLTRSQKCSVYIIIVVLL